MPLNVGPLIVSKLGSPDSRIPLFVKDSFNSAGFTYFSYDAGGSVEGKDRLVDEVGTAAIWLGGIPLYRKITDLTLYKKAGISSDVDFRITKDKNYLKQAIQNAPNEEARKELQKAGRFIGKTKNLARARFLISMAMTMLSYLGLTKYKQDMTRSNIEKEFMKNMEAQEQNTPVKQQNKPDVFAPFKPSFGNGAIKFADEVMLHPIKNMMLLDLGISGQRLGEARTSGERAEYGIKEGSFLFFTYQADKIIRKKLEELSQKHFKMPIALDAKFLASDLAEKMLKNDDMHKQVKDFIKKFDKNTNDFYEFIFKNQDNAVVAAAKQAGVIETLKNDKTKIDTRKFIEPDEIKKFAMDLDSYIESGKNSTNTKEFMKKIRGLKLAATALSIGACCLSLGYLVPKLIYTFRKNSQDGSSNYHVREEYEKELAAKNATKKLSA